MLEHLAKIVEGGGLLTFVHTGQRHLIVGEKQLHAERRKKHLLLGEKHLHSGERLEHLAKIVEGGGLLELLLNTSCCHLFQAAAGNSNINFKKE